MMQSRQAEMGELLAMIAHQWRQPLSSISTISASIKINNEIGQHSPEALDRDLSKIDELTHYLSQTINDFKDYFKPTKIKTTTTLEKVIKEATSLIDPYLQQHNIELDITIVKDTPLSIYKNELTQVIVNILKNGIDVLIEKSIVPAKIAVSIDQNDSFSVISITDNVGGIDEDIITKIFDPYFSTKSKNGTGLGLYMSKTIIQEHMQGQLQVSNSHNGAQFNISLPLKPTL